MTARSSTKIFQRGSCEFGGKGSCSFDICKSLRAGNRDKTLLMEK